MSPLVGCNGDTSNQKYSEPENLKIIYLTSTDSTGVLMKEDEFWKIIERSIIDSKNDYQVQIKSLENILLTLNSTEIEKFDNTFRALLAASYDTKLWGASYVINGGCSDDCFEYFREYLIAHGKNKFYATLKDPESCAPWIKSEGEDNWEGIRYSASKAYKQTTGKELSYSYQPKCELKGKLFDEATVEKQYPKLAEKF
jgi:hypothetical protein